MRTFEDRQQRDHRGHLHWRQGVRSSHEMGREFSIDCCLVAGRFTLLDQQPLDHFLPDCQRRGISLIAAVSSTRELSGRGSRRLTRTYNYSKAPPVIMASVEQLEEVCREVDVALPLAAIQFVAAHLVVITVCKAPAAWRSFDKILRPLSTSISAKFWVRLMERGLVVLNAPTAAA